jgi:hypothetical protein
MSKENACSYNTLGAYNSMMQQQAMMRGIHPPVPAGTPNMAVQVVPVYGMPGYETLTHGDQCGCGDYFSIGAAYPDFGNNCTKFTQRLCSGDI